MKQRRPNLSSSIYKGKDGSWHGRVTVGITPEGKTDRRHVRGTTEAGVRKKVRALERQREDGMVPEIITDWTVQAWLEYWLEELSKPYVSDNTYDGYRVAVRNHLIPAIGMLKLTTLRAEHLEKLYRSMLLLKTRRGTTMKPGRVAQVHRTVRTALNEAVKRGHIQRNPATLAKCPPLHDDEIEPYTVAEVRRIIEVAATERNGSRWVVALALGLRQGEVLGLKWEDIDLDQGTVRVRRNRLRPKYQHGCEDPCGRKYAGHCPLRVSARKQDSTPKTRAGRRYVPIPGVLVQVLRAHAEFQGEEAMEAGMLWHDERWVYTNEVGKPLNARTEWDRWKALLKKAGVRDARLHDARHTAATVLLQLGVSERTMMAIMGWSSSSMVARYAHVVAPTRQAIARQVNGLLWEEDAKPNS